MKVIYKFCVVCNRIVEKYHKVCPHCGGKLVNIYQ